MADDSAANMGSTEPSGLLAGLAGRLVEVPHPGSPRSADRAGPPGAGQPALRKPDTRSGRPSRSSTSAIGANDMDRHRLLTLRGELRSHLLWDLPFIAMYGAGFVLGALLPLAVARSTSGRAGPASAFAAGVAVVADLVETGLRGRRWSRR